MPTNINSLPFDVVHYIALELDIRSYVNLSRVNRRFNQLLKDENTANQCLQRNAKYCKELQLVPGNGNPKDKTYQVLSRIFDQREAFRTCNPYSASILAYGTSFVFNQGFFCYVYSEEIRILDTSQNSRLEKVIDGNRLGSQLIKGLGLPLTSDDFVQHLSLLSYANGVLVFLCDERYSPASWLFAFDVSDIDRSDTANTTSRNRLRFRRRLQSKTKLFVRHNASFLYYGTHSVLADHGHHEWLLQGCDLNTGRPISSKPLRLNDFVGSEVGSTACFALHGDEFYAVSNQTSFVAEEIDWTSSYHYTRFKADNPNPDLKVQKVWRRQHLEGPINDAWTELSLQVDEQTHNLLIVECRKEWHCGGSVSTRTYYTQPFPTPSATPESEPESVNSISTSNTTSNPSTSSSAQPPNHSFPPNDPLSRTLDSTSKPSYEVPPTRLPHSYHREYPPSTAPQSSQEFIRAKTKHHAYNLPASSFIDLVSDSVSVAGSVRPRDRVRLRVASRLLMSSLLDPDPGVGCQYQGLLRPREVDENDEPILGSEERFRPTQITLWPPTDAPASLTQLLCPGGRIGSVNAVSDEKGVLYMAGMPDEAYGGERAVVRVSFDPGWGWEGLRGLRLGGKEEGGLGVEGLRLDPPGLEGEGDRGGLTFGGKRKIEPEEMLGVGRLEKRVKMDVLSEETAVKKKPVSLLRTEGAMYLAINQGFWLR